jgi:hypothetical protein
MIYLYGTKVGQIQQGLFTRITGKFSNFKYSLGCLIPGI